MVKIPEIILKTRRAAEQAEGIIRSLSVIEPPIDPLKVVESEAPLLVARGDELLVPIAESAVGVRIVAVPAAQQTGNR